MAGLHWTALDWTGLELASWAGWTAPVGIVGLAGWVGLAFWLRWACWAELAGLTHLHGRSWHAGLAAAARGVVSLRLVIPRDSWPGAHWISLTAGSALNGGERICITYIYIYISEVGGGSLAHPTGKSFRFVHACVLSLWSHFRMKMLTAPPVSFIYSPRRSKLVSCVIFGSVRFIIDLLRVLVNYAWVLISFNWFSMLLRFIDFSWVQVSSHWAPMSSHWVPVSSIEFWWV